MHTLFAQLSLAGLLAGAPLVLPSHTAMAGSDAMPGMEMGGSPSHAHPEPTQFSFGAPASATSATRTVRIVMGDVKFDPAEVTVRAGETVRFLISNTSSLDHEFTLGDARTEQAHRREMAEMQSRGHAMTHDDPNTITVKPGQTRTLTWKFSRAGRLEYDCNIPGHYESGMKGAITVR